MAQKRPTPARRPEPNPRHRLLVALVGAGLTVGIIAIAMSVGGEDPARATDRDPETVALGARLYAADCAVCHGTDLRGTATGPPFLNSIYAPNHHADEAFQRAVAFGVVPHHWNFGPMEPRPGLTREEVAAIVAFVRAEQEAAGIFRDPSHP